MKASDVKVDIKRMRMFKKQNALERLDFLDFWANYVKRNPDKDWSEQQNIVINSQIDK